MLNVVSGIGTIVGSFWGPVAGLARAPAGAAHREPGGGPASDPLPLGLPPRFGGAAHRVFASTAAALAVLVPSTLLLTMAGMALLGGLIGAIREIAKGPLVLGPVFAFAISLSEMTLFGLGPFFWVLVLDVFRLAPARTRWLEAAPGGGGRAGRTDGSTRPGLTAVVTAGSRRRSPPDDSTAWVAR